MIQGKEDEKRQTFKLRIVLLKKLFERLENLQDVSVLAAMYTTDFTDAANFLLGDTCDRVNFSKASTNFEVTTGNEDNASDNSVSLFSAKRAVVVHNLEEIFRMSVDLRLQVHVILFCYFLL